MKTPDNGVERRFECPHCGQHYLVDEKWHEQSIVCRTCGQIFQPDAPASTGVGSSSATIQAGEAIPPSQIPPVRARQRINVPKAAFKTPPSTDSGAWSNARLVLLGLITPPVVVVVAAIAFPVTGFLPLLGLAVGPAAGYLTSALMCRFVYRRAGCSGLLYYIKRTFASFVLWGILAAVGIFFMFDSLGEGAGLIMPVVMIAVGLEYFFLAVFWLWAAASFSSATSRN